MASDLRTTTIDTGRVIALTSRRITEVLAIMTDCEYLVGVAIGSSDPIRWYVVQAVAKHRLEIPDGTGWMGFVENDKDLLSFLVFELPCKVRKFNDLYPNSWLPSRSANPSKASP